MQIELSEKQILRLTGLVLSSKTQCENNQFSDNLTEEQKEKLKNDFKDLYDVLLKCCAEIPDEIIQEFNEEYKGF